MRKPEHRWKCIGSVLKALTGTCLLLQAGLMVLPVHGFAAQEAEPDQVSRIAVLTHSFSSEYWGYVKQGCLAYDTVDPSVIVDVQEATSSIASDEQAMLLQEDLDSGTYDAYVISAINRESIEDVLRDVTVPVIAMNAPIDADCVIGGTGMDNEVAAAAGAKKAVEMALQAGWEKPGCVMIGGSEEDANQVVRMNGFRKGIEENGGIWLDAVYPTDKSADGAREAIKQIMKDNPDGVAIVACYNDVLAVNALEEASSNPAFENTVFLGFDGNGSICDRIMNDEQYANMVTVAQNPYEMGFHAVEMLSQYLMEEKSVEISASADAGDGASADAGDGTSADAGDGASTEAGDAGSAESEAEALNWYDSGYTVITKVNAQERMLQIMSHLR